MMVMHHEKRNKYPVNTMMQAPRHCPCFEDEEDLLEEVADCAVPSLVEPSHSSLTSIVSAITLDGDCENSLEYHANSSHRFTPNLSPFLEQEERPRGERSPIERNLKDCVEPDVLKHLSSSRPLAQSVRASSDKRRPTTIWKNAEREEGLCLEEVADWAVPRAVEPTLSSTSNMSSMSLDGNLFEDSLVYSNSSHRFRPNLSPMLEQEETLHDDGRLMRRNSNDRFEPDLLKHLSSSRPPSKPERWMSSYTTERLPEIKAGKLPKVKSGKQPDSKTLMPPHMPLRQRSAQWGELS
jgi:hypothetical protein